MIDKITASLPEQTRLYLRILTYIKPYRIRFTIGLLAALPAGGMDGALAWLAGRGLQRIFIDGHQELIYWAPIAVLVLIAVQGVGRFLEAYFIRYVGASAIRDLRNQMFAHLEKQPLLYFQGQSSGVLIGRMINDVAVIENAIAQTFQTMLSRIVTLISLILVVVWQSWQLSLIALSIMSLIIVPVQILSKKIRKSSRSGQEAIGSLTSVLSESIQGTKIVQSFNLEQYQTDRFMDTNSNVFNSIMKAVLAEALMSPILAMIGAVGIACVMWYAGYQVLHHHMNLGSLTSFLLALILLYSPMKNLGRIQGIIQPAMAAATRVFEVLDQALDLSDDASAVALPPGLHSVEFQHVFFHYPSSQDIVLKDINLDIPAGRMVALVGLSGSGKSTMVNLVPRFFDPQSGAILIDGKPLKHYTLSSVRSQIAMVTQDNFLFNTSVRENIRLGRLDATDDELVAAAKAAYCHDFISELPEGYDSQIGERGVKLSGGQQQRLAIARAFLKDAPILILDEATSSLDNESEAMVQAALNKLMEGRTVIVIAHRLSTVRHADQIVVMQAGEIVETGTHSSLEQAGNTYARLLTAQFERPVSSI
jgi:subfamily B ATP-binding cassette protein MsbA